MSVSLANVEAARRAISGHVLRTPMLPAPRLATLTGAEVYVKYENLQVTNSFKERGASISHSASGVRPWRRSCCVKKVI